MTERQSISLKLYVNPQLNRVLFAEVRKEFVNFLLQMLSLPLATANRLLREHEGMVGSISNLFSSIQNMDVCYIHQKTKDTFLNPKLFNANNYDSHVRLLLPENCTSLNEKTLYKCPSCNFTSDMNQYCPNHSSYLQPRVLYESQSSVNKPREGGFVEGIVTYIVLDNLDVKPMSDFSVIKNLLTEFDVTNVALLEEKVVKLGMDEALKLLKASMESQTVLTDVFLKSTKSGV